MAGTDLSNLVSHCDLYCNACGIRQGKIEKGNGQSSAIIAHYGFDRLIPQTSEWEPNFKHG